MKIKKNKKMKNMRSGSSLVFVLIAFMIISIFAFSILNIFNANLKQAKHQQDRLEAYYLAYSGAELAFAALLDNNNENLKKLTRTVNPVSELKEENIEFGNGKITVVSKKSTDANFNGLVEISSTATLNKNNQSFTRVLYFDPLNPVDMIWKNK